MAERMLTLRELNRATLARQLLLERVHLSALDAIKQLAGLWSRVHAFQRHELTQLLEQRQVVRTSLMRRTLHLTTAEGYLRFRPALHALHPRDLGIVFAKYQQNSLEKEHLLAEMRGFLNEHSRTNVELREKLVASSPYSSRRCVAL